MAHSKTGAAKDHFTRQMHYTVAGPHKQLRDVCFDMLRLACGDGMQQRTVMLPRASDLIRPSPPAVGFASWRTCTNIAGDRR